MKQITRLLVLLLALALAVSLAACGTADSQDSQSDNDGTKSHVTIPTGPAIPDATWEGDPSDDLPQPEYPQE